MVNKKPIRTRGKIQLSKYFQKFSEGDKVAVVEERSLTKNIPSRFQGRTGVVLSRQGRNYMIRINDTNKEKDFLVEPIHLKKIKNQL